MNTASEDNACSQVSIRIIIIPIKSFQIWYIQVHNFSSKYMIVLKKPLLTCIFQA